MDDLNRNTNEIIMHIHNLFRFADPVFRLGAMSVKKMGEILGLKKVDSYWLVKKGFFNVITFAGKMWIETASFEQWYSGQHHYHKVTGLTEEEVRKDYYSIRDMMGFLDIGESTVYRVISKAGIL